MNSRERVRLASNHKEPDRVPIHDSLWESTIERWRNEGLSADAKVEDYFGYDMKIFFPDITLQFTYKILDETDEFIIERNAFGEIVKNFKNRSTTPQIIESPIKNRRDWNRLKERLKVNEERGLTPSPLDYSKIISLDEGLKDFDEYSKKDRYMVYSVVVGFDLIQRYLGMERLLIAIVTEPEWVREMFYANAQFVIEMYEHMEEKGYLFDAVYILDDLGYRNSTLFSPNHYKEILFESDKLICDYFHDKDIKVILHSCGCVKALIPYFIEAGIDCLQPLEVKAGMDLIELKLQYGDKIAFMGGIDIRLFSQNDPAMIEEEIKTKFEIAKKNGGYIYHSDHSVPLDVSLSQYEKVLDLVLKYGKY